MSCRHQAQPTLTRQTCYATRVLTLLIENWWHIQSSLSLGTHGGPWLIFCRSREYQLFFREVCSLDITMLIAAQSNKEEHKQKTRKGCWIIYASSSQTMHLHPFCPHSQSLIKHLHNILLPALYFPCSIILGYITQHFHITIISSSAPVPSEAVFWLSRSRGLDTDHENCCHESWDRDPGPRARLMSQASLQTLSCAGFGHFIVIFRLSDKSFMVQKICKSEDDLLLTVIELDADFLSQNIFYLIRIKYLLETFNFSRKAPRHVIMLCSAVSMYSGLVYDQVCSRYQLCPRVTKALDCQIVFYKSTLGTPIWLRGSYTANNQWTLYQRRKSTVHWLIWLTFNV